MKLEHVLSENINESLTTIPWRSGNIHVAFGKVVYQGKPEYCIVLDKLKYIGRLKPSFLIMFRRIDLLSKPAKQNATVVYPKYANQNFVVDPIAQTECYLDTTFVGDKKEGRTFDWWFRLFEYGFTLKKFKDTLDIKGIRIDPNTKINISVAKDKYKTPTFATGDTGSKISTSVRVKRT